MIKLVVFDLWRTLAYRGSHRSIRHVIQKMLPERHYSGYEAGKMFESGVQLKKWHVHEKHSEERAYANLCKVLKIPSTHKNVHELMGMRDKEESHIKLYVHVIPMLKALRKQGIKIALASNSSVFIIDKVKRKTNLFKYIDYPVFSFDVGVIKPDLKIFREVLRKAKVKPAEAIMVGDKLSDDVRPPRKIDYVGWPKLKKDFKKYGINLGNI